MKDYHINIFYSNEDDGYIADIPDLRHCSAFGVTPVEALSEVLKAKDAWLKTAKKNRKTVPIPSYHPLIYKVAWKLFVAYFCMVYVSTRTFFVIFGHNG